MALPTLLKVALPSVPGVNQLPGIRKQGGPFTGLTETREAVTVSRDHVSAYAAVCGFPSKDTVPLTYPHLLAFPLHMAIMSDPAYPYPAIGAVHLTNVITSHRPIRVGETLGVTTSAEPGRPHPKGTVVDFVTTVTADGSTVWESVSTYLRRGRGTQGADAGLTLHDVPAGTTQWRLPADLGRRYAAVSGDHNPIHLYPLTAKALGFPRQIAHGMWTKARCVAALENRLPDAVRVEVVFKKPVFLPGTVAFGHDVAQGQGAFALTSPKDSSPHLIGRATAL